MCSVCAYTHSHTHSTHIFHKYRFSLLYVYYVRGSVLQNMVHRTRRHLASRISQSRLAVIYWGQFCSPAPPHLPRDIWQYLETSLVATTLCGGVCYWHLWIETRDATKYSTMHRTASTTKNDLA